MSVTSIGQYLSDGLAIALIIRLLALRLHSVYRVFCAFLIVDLFSSLVFLLEKSAYLRLDYRLTWMTIRPIIWILCLWMVYALLDAMLGNLPGILRISRKLLNFAFVAALILAFFTGFPEYSASSLSGSGSAIERGVGATFVIERVIFMAAVLVLFAILAFILWFPVQMPRNLAVFSIGFAVYFSTITALLLINTYWPHTDLRLVSDIATFTLAACYLYWLIFINRAGETRPVRMGHSWGREEQQRLIGELEAMNAALLRASRRPN
jgi:hypothetical protein